MPEEPYSHLVGRCQQLVEIRKLQIKLAEESIPEILDECEYIDDCEIEHYLTIKIDEKKFIEDTIKMTLDHYSD